MKNNIETRLIGAADVVPVLGFFTNLAKIFKYNTETNLMQKGVITTDQNPKSRNIKRTVTAAASVI